MLEMVPPLRLRLLQYEQCHGDECYSTVIDNWHDSMLLRPLFNVANPFVMRALHRLGLRFWSFGAKVELRGDRIHNLYHFLLVDDGTGGYPGVVTLEVGSLRGSNHGVGNLIRDESPDYQISSYFKWPKLDLRVLFAPAASPALVHHAFDLHLDCVWQFKGVEHPLTIFDTDMIPNPAVNLLRPGASVLMFTDPNGMLEEPCEIMAATPSALRTIRAALASPTSQVAESDRPLW